MNYRRVVPQVVSRVAQSAALPVAVQVLRLAVQAANHQAVEGLVLEPTHFLRMCCPPVDIRYPFFVRFRRL